MGAAAIVAVFTVAAAGVWFFVVVFLGLSWGPNDLDGSTLTDGEAVVIYGLAAVVTLTPGLVLASHLLTLSGWCQPPAGTGPPGPRSR